MTDLTTLQDVDDYLRGADFLSACGGGDPVAERALLYEDLESGLSLGWSPLDTAAHGLFCTACFSGSIAPAAFEAHPEADALAPKGRLRRPLQAAIVELQNYLGEEITGIVSIEIGGSNSGAVLDAAANLGKLLVDGDYAGRAIPELTATTPHLFKVPVLPWAFADEFGNRLVMREAASDEFAERLGKFLALGSFGTIGCALLPLTAQQVGEVYIPGTLSECLALGRAIRVAREEGSDPVAAAAQALAGWVLFRGRLATREWKNTGYLEGTHEITGEGESAGHVLKVWFKNENHLSWLDGQPFVTSPDLIELCDAATGEPLSNTSLREGTQVAVVGRRRRDPYDSPRGLDVLGPRHFGFDIEFTGIETLMHK